jgi:hypothetical protein
MIAEFPAITFRFSPPRFRSARPLGQSGKFARVVNKSSKPGIQGGSPYVFGLQPAGLKQLTEAALS